MVKIYFGCSMRGGREVVSREELAKIPKIIEELGYELISKHQTQEGILEIENRLTETARHDRDYQWLSDSDLGIFEISNPSLGVGGEISDAIHLEKPVLCLFRKGLEYQVSAYIQGKEGSKFVKTQFECYAYETLEEVKHRIKGFVEKAQN